ncbi:MAG: citrate transporter [Candidatus Accumulibacter phosphatis]|jgi:Na+/H+ antiporter NhaD/arsenite permease-like protein|uniref:Na+/H+ antiporter, NhaD family n=1 Tax=Candidatus Accumulibacter phosphatis TaxID=327160 RepID=A0A080M699_9PROT|nr:MULTISPECIES: citrate transporter [Candidatus Accumulibacter]KFB72579.1 MAG: Na+/H+ antiporter, NhaD family [Candidatus Accumulibacter phosphatis]
MRRTLGGLMNTQWLTLAVCCQALPVQAADGSEVLGIPVEFILFAATLLGVALFHHRVLQVALTGLVVIALYKIAVTGFRTGAGLGGFAGHMAHEWVLLVNLLCLLVGFALLARHFEDSGVPEVLPRLLPESWLGPFVLLAIIWLLSSFLDNIAAALIGGTVAASVFKRRLHVGYLAAIVAASNAGGAWSVIGDTTTTMMWIAGVSPLDVTHAFLASAVALVVSGIPAALQQHAHQPIVRNLQGAQHVDWARVGIVGFMLGTAIGTNVTVNIRFPEAADHFPFLGVAVWVALLLAVPLRKPEWSLLPEAIKGSVFLLALVSCASMMPVEKLPLASWQTALGLGFVSAVFDNIPLTALALKQGGYDWGILAFAVGFGGSMLWFGSSAGVALANLFPEARSAGKWLLHGWHVPLGYVAGFFALLLILGWRPHAAQQGSQVDPPPVIHSQTVIGSGAISL